MLLIGGLSWGILPKGLSLGTYVKELITGGGHVWGLMFRVLCRAHDRVVCVRGLVRKGASVQVAYKLYKGIGRAYAYV